MITIPMIKAILFDLDGTLANTVEDIAAAVNAALADFGFPPRRTDEMHRMVGNGMRKLVERALPPGAAAAVVDECAAKATAAYAEKPAVLTEPYPGARELLAAVAERGIPASIISNKPDALTAMVVAALFPGYPFRVVQGEKEGVPRKPDPAASLAIAAAMGARPEETLYLGDSDVDMLTANAAGFLAVGAAWGFRGRAELEAAGAARVIEAPEDLLGLLPPPRI